MAVAVAARAATALMVQATTAAALAALACYPRSPVSITLAALPSAVGPGTATQRSHLYRLMTRYFEEHLPAPELP